MADVSARGRFVWYDLLTTDPKRVEPFYTAVAGWGTETWAGAMPYTMWTAGGTAIGGVMGMPPSAEAPPHWLAYAAVPDVDASLAQALGLGGRTLKGATDIPGVGRFAVLTDPQGAEFALFTPAADAPGQETPPGLGEFSWHELLTTDYKAAFEFYKALFGWEMIQEHDMGPMGIYAIFGRNGTQVGGMFNKTDDMPIPPNWLHYVRVDDADRVAGVVQANGGTVINGPMDVPGGDRIAQCLDPLGAMFAVHAIKR
jgi:uncharacterized protein